MTTLSSLLRNTLLTGLVLISMVGMPAATFAQGNPQIIPGGWVSQSQNPGGIPCDIIHGYMKAACIPMFIGNLVMVVFSVISAFFILNVIYAGYQIALGSWTGEKSEGKDRLTWSIIGLVVCVCAYLILALIISIVTP